MNIKKYMILSLFTACATGYLAANAPNENKKSTQKTKQEKKAAQKKAAQQAKNKKKPSQKAPNKMLGSNPYTYAPQYFTADNGITGRYWAGNKQYPGKAFIEDEEYRSIVVIEQSLCNEKEGKKLRRYKDYLGFYIDPVTNTTYNLYGIKKYAYSSNDGPDSDVLTQIMIKQDYGIDE